MAISLEYRFTFINVLEEIDYERSAALSRRSSSLPPSRTRTESCDALECDEKDGQYVQTLTEKLPSIFGAQGAEEEILSSTMDAQDTEADVAMQSWSTAEITESAVTESAVSESAVSESNEAAWGIPNSADVPASTSLRGSVATALTATFAICRMPTVRPRSIRTSAR